MGFFSKLFGPKVDLADLIQNQKAYIVDVRTPGEFRQGKVRGSVNIPLNNIANADNKLKGRSPIVLCCASGSRSGQAARILRSKGFDAHNGGSWQNVKRYK